MAGTSSLVLLFLSHEGIFGPLLSLLFSFTSTEIFSFYKRKPDYILIFCGDKQVPGYEYGNFVGPSILSGVTADMECYKVLFIKLFVLVLF